MSGKVSVVMEMIEEARPIVSLRGVGVEYVDGRRRVWAVRGRNVEVPRGKLVALRGVSGSGTTTLLSVASLLQCPTEGAVALNGVDVSAAGLAARDRLRRDNVGILFQQGALVEHLTLIENVSLPILATEGRADREWALDLLDRVGLADHADKLPGAVSGGQAQRAAFCRAIARTPQLLIADEPTSSLDAASAASVLDLLTGFVADGGGVLLATHDDAVTRIADTVIDLDRPTEERVAA